MKFLDFSLPSTPEHSPKNVSIPNHLDINSNTDRSLPIDDVLPLDNSKDYYDRRKSDLEQIKDLGTSPNGITENCSVLEVGEDSGFPNTNNYKVENCCIVQKENSGKISEIAFTEVSETDENSEIKNFKSDNIHETAENSEIKDVKSDETHEEDDFSRFPEKFDCIVEKPVSHSPEIEKCQLESLQENANFLSNQLTVNEVSSNTIISNNPEENKSTTNTKCVSNEHLDESEISTSLNMGISDQLDSLPYIDTDFEVNQILDTQKSEEPLEVKKVNSEMVNEAVESDIKDPLSEDILKTVSIKETNLQVLDSKDNEFSSGDIDDNFADFSDFHSFSQPILSAENQISSPTISNIPKVKKSEDGVIENDNYDDDDFGNFISTPNPSTIKEQESNPSTFDFNDDYDEDDDFGDFQDISTLPVENLPLPSNPLEKAQQVFEELFPKIENDEISDYVFQEIEKDSHIFEILKDVTDTPGLTYQWAKSASQKLLLKALNIDERNIVSHIFIYLFSNFVYSMKILFYFIFCSMMFLKSLNIYFVFC